MNTVLMYVVKSENEIPMQVLPNTAYYIIGKEVRIIDNLGQMSTFIVPPKEASVAPTDELDKRIVKCEKQLEKIVKHLTSFSGDLV
jgi:hypothetical protein